MEKEELLKEMMKSQPQPQQKLDPEIEVLNKIVEELKYFDLETKNRMLEYLWGRFYREDET